MKLFRSLDAHGVEHDVAVSFTTGGWIITRDNGAAYPDEMTRRVKDRIYAALANTGHNPPRRSVYAIGDNWWPGYDLGLYLALIGTDIHDRLVVGEISLDGSPSPVTVCTATLVDPREDP